MMFENIILRALPAYFRFRGRVFETTGLGIGLSGVGGYYVDAVGKNEKKIAEYIRNQLQEDIASYQISLKEFIDPFMGEKNKET